RAQGVAALVQDGASVGPALEVLLAREVILARPGSAESEFVFRHALLRDAAYELLTEDDRRLAHGLAGEFVERQGEHNAIVLVEHFERGGLLARAAHHCGRAAAQAFEANDLHGAIERVARGVSDGAQGETLGAMRLVEAQARIWIGHFADAEVAAREAVALTRGAARLHAASELMAALGQLGKYQEMTALLAQAHLWGDTAQHRPAWHHVLLRAAGYLPSGVQRELAEELLGEVERTPLPDHPALDGLLHRARGLLYLGPQPGLAAVHFQRSLAH